MNQLIQDEQNLNTGLRRILFIILDLFNETAGFGNGFVCHNSAYSEYMYYAIDTIMICIKRFGLY